jgi:hypothetical protein
MTLRRLPEQFIAASKDETLAHAITAHFTGAVWPSDLANEAHIARFGHDGPPPTPYGAPWPLESGERWLAHGLGTFFFGLEARGEFKRAGAAAILVTTRGVRLVLGAGGPEKPSGWLLASKGDRNAPKARLEPYRFRFIELTEIGAGDLMFLHFWRLEPLVLRVPWPRSMAALISGLRAIEKQPNALENGTVTVSNASKSREITVEQAREIVVEKKTKRV